MNTADMRARDETVTGEPSASASRRAAVSGVAARSDGAACRRPSGRWWLGVLVGCLLALPVGWLLSYGASLPFFLGLFFFVLFGLVIGAVMHRIASQQRPFRRAPLLVGTVAVVIVLLVASLVNEARDFPMDMAKDVSAKTRDIGGSTLEAFQARVAADVRLYLRQRFAPGGSIGYFRWILAGGEVRKDHLSPLRMTYVRRPNGWAWAVRVLLSVVALAFGIGSQTLLLRLEYDPAVRAIDAKKQRAASQD